MNAPGTGGQPGGFGRDVGPFLTIGLQLAIAVVAFFFVGYWLDGKFGTSPWCSIGGAFLGVAGGLAKFLKEAIALGRKADEKYKDEKANRED
ncbi:MAG: AtpZ/AtpI family protein [Bacteroidota bacterium]